MVKLLVAHRNYSNLKWSGAGRSAGLLLSVLSAFGCGGRPVAPVDGSADAQVLPEASVVEAALLEEVKVAEGDLKTAPLGSMILDPAAQYSEKGHAASARAQIDEAVILLGAALRLSPGRTADRLLLIDLLLRQHRISDARRHIDSLPSPEDTAPAVIARVRLLAGAAMFQEARTLIFDYWGSNAPEAGELRLLLAATECALGRPDAAFALMEQTVSNGETEAACGTLLKAASLGPGRPL